MAWSNINTTYHMLYNVTTISTTYVSTTRSKQRATLERGMGQPLNVSELYIYIYIYIYTCLYTYMTHSVELIWTCIYIYIYIYIWLHWYNLVSCVFILVYVYVWFIHLCKSLRRRSNTTKRPKRTNSETATENHVYLPCSCQTVSYILLH